jgi:hypothetical protein
MAKPKDLFSDQDLEQIQTRCDRQLRLAAAMAELQAVAPKAPRGGQVPDFPPEPNFNQTFITIPLRFAAEAVKNASDSLGILTGITLLLGTQKGRDLLARLKQALINHTDDPTVFGDVLQFFGSLNGKYGSFVLGFITEAQGIYGAAALTGVAFPTTPGGKPKWFGGAKKSKGLGAEATASLLFGYRVEEPQDLTGQFYGYHAGIDIELSIGTNFYFDTTKKLGYQGFLTSLGVGIGLGTAVFWGWELVNPG